LEEEIERYLRDTDLTLQEIADKLSVGYKIVWKVFHKVFTIDEIKLRKQTTYRKSRLGELNPMFGKRKEQIHNYIGEVSDGRGYLMVLKPDWYTGRKGSRHVFKHTIVMCESLGLTELPEGFVIHHIDGNPLNNEIHNLALVSTNGHSRLHHWKEQRLGESRRRNPKRKATVAVNNGLQGG
jgi:hypothetical protein